MKLYHGTSAIFTSFVLPKECICHEYYGPAIYFSTDYDTAKYYGDSVIEIELDDDLIDKVLDAHGHGIKALSNVLIKEIENGGIIAVNNCADYNLEGAQCRYFDIDDYDCADYKHFIGFMVNVEFRKKEEANKIASIMEDLGVKAFVSRSVVNRKYRVYNVGSISEDVARMLKNAGVAIQKGVQKSAPVATTVIFAGDRGLDILNSLAC